MVQKMVQKVVQKMVQKMVQSIFYPMPSKTMDNQSHCLVAWSNNGNIWAHMRFIFSASRGDDS